MGKKARRLPVTESRPQRPARSGDAASVSWTERDPRYWPAVGALFAFALGMRLFHLTTPIFQADEAIYSVFARNFNNKPVVVGTGANALGFDRVRGGALSAMVGEIDRRCDPSDTLAVVPEGAFVKVGQRVRAFPPEWPSFTLAAR